MSRDRDTTTTHNWIDVGAYRFETNDRFEGWLIEAWCEDCAAVAVDTRWVPAR